MTEIVSKVEFARRIGKSEKWVRKLVIAGKIPTVARGKIEWDEGIAAYSSAYPGNVPAPTAAPAAERTKQKPSASPTRVTRAEFARRVKKSTRWVDKLIAAGRVHVGADGLIDWSPALAEYRGASQPESAPRSAPIESEAPAAPSGMTVAEVNAAFNRARLAEKQAAARLKQLEYKTRSGLLMLTEDAVADTVELATRIRVAVQAIPARVAPLLEGRTVAEIEAILDTATTEALQALSEGK